MRKLIKHILNEEVSKQQIDKGIDIVVNGLKNEFPFVVGWQLHNDYEEYRTSIYIDLVVEYEKVKEFYGLEPKTMYNIEYIKNKQVAYVLTPFKYEGNFDPYIESQKLSEYVFEMYEYIPEELSKDENDEFNELWDEFRDTRKTLH
jgi:hypothetical protein